MADFHYEWWHVKIKEATGETWVEFKAKSKDHAIKQIKQYAKKHTEFVQKRRPDFETVVYWNTLTLDRIGYQRLS